MENDEKADLISIAKRIRAKQAMFFSDIQDIHRMCDAILANQAKIRLPEKRQMIRNNDGILSVVDCYICDEFERLNSSEEQ